MSDRSLSAIQGEKELIFEDLIVFFNQTFRLSTFLWNDFEKYRRKTLDPFSKTAVVDYLLRISYLNKHNHQNFTYKILKEYYFINNIVTYMRKGFYLLKDFDEIVGRMSANGLISYWVAQQTDLTQTNLKPKTTSLNLFQLEGIFTIWLYGLMLSTVLFALEFTFYFCQKKIKIIAAGFSSTFIYS